MLSTKKTRVREILTVVGQKRKILILCHNNPDPDAIGSAFALQTLLQQTLKRKAIIAFGGHIIRAENREFKRRLKIKMTPVQEIDFSRFSIICLVDTQPGAGNNALPRNVVPQIVIDHHQPFRRDTTRCEFYDILPEYGSTATIITQYLIDLNLEVDKRVATALFYGLKTDTNNLLRSKNKADLDVFNYLFPKVALKTLGAIEHPAVPHTYYLQLDNALQNSHQYKDVLISHMGRLYNPDGVAEMAEFLLRMENIRWSLCLGEFNQHLYLSVRTSRRGWYAGNIAGRILKGIGSGGGHEKTAGGSVDLRDRSPHEISRISQKIIDRFLKIVNISPDIKKPLLKKK
ncbi:bifunctional oligoribonuclease/PAP phosphatase NrnA [candidate division CSSED10-310 bacterium]|uniref:Bifunctional oligoribonuclease/PAP phosphatase NrnA n=1 Tax=candidate division CSSED10-310 bacterium TaxID=2855610 RepID=A0ABV6YUR3_UNCC1